MSLQSLQRKAQAGAKEATGVEKFFGAPGRNQGEINRIIELWRGDIVREVNFTLQGMKNGINEVTSTFEYPSATKAVTYFEKTKKMENLSLISDALLDQLRKMKNNERTLKYEIIGGVPTPIQNKVFEEYKTKMDILLTQAKIQMGQLLMTKTSAAEGLLNRLRREEKQYQERLAGFRSGWVIGTAFVAVKQGVERILNDPVLRKAYLETFAVAIGLIPVIGPLIARVMRAAAVDRNFDIGDFLREFFSQGVANVMKFIALEALGQALPPGISPALKKVITMSTGIVSSSIGAEGAKKLVQGVSSSKRRLNDIAKKSVQKV